MKFASFTIERSQGPGSNEKWIIYKVFPPVDSEVGKTDYIVLIKSPEMGQTVAYPLNKDFSKVDYDTPLGGKTWDLKFEPDGAFEEMGYKLLIKKDVNFKTQEEISQEIAAQGDNPPQSLLPPEQQQPQEDPNAAAMAAPPIQDPNAQPQIDAAGNTLPVEQPQVDQNGNPIQVPDEQQAQVQAAQESELRDYIYKSFIESKSK